MNTVQDIDGTTVAQPAEDEAGAMHRPLVVFSLDDQRYALSIDQVERSIRVVAITPLPKAPAIVLGIVDLGGDVIPVIDTRKRFNHPAVEIRLSDHLVVARSARRSVALLVDRTNGVMEYPKEGIVPADKILPGLELIGGAVRLENGLVLIHDLDRLLSLEEETAIDHALSGVSGSEAAG